MLRFWLPYNKDGRMVGLSPTSAASYSNVAIVDGSPTGGKCASGYKIFHTATEEFGNAWTIATWVNSAGWSQYNDIISCKNTSASTYCQWYFSIVNAKTFNLGINGGSSTVSLSYNFSANTWYHVAATYDGEKYAMYINGECVKSGAYSSAMNTGCTNVCVVCRSTNAQGTSPTGGSPKTSDFRIYDHALEAWEIKKIYNSIMFGIMGGLHLKETTNLGGSSISYDGKNYGQEYAASTWGGDSGKIKYFKDGGYNNFPYKEYHKTASGSGGVYMAQTRDITIESGKTYTMSVYVKSNRNFNDSYYSFNINGVIPGDSNHYITYAKNVPFTTKWNRLSRTFTATTAETGNFSEMSIVYDDAVKDYYVYYSGFQIESGSTLTPFTYGHRDERYADLSGNNNDIIPYNIVQSGSALYFNGTNSAIQVPIVDTIRGGTWTINLWFYRPNGQWGTKSWETLIGGPSGFELSSKNGGSNTPQIRTYSWTNSGYTYEYDKWNMVTLARTPSGAKCYLNGELKHNGTAGSVPNGNYFIGAWNTATQQNFKGYIRSFSIYKKELSQEDITNLYIHGQ